MIASLTKYQRMALPGLQLIPLYRILSGVEEKHSRNSGDLGVYNSQTLKDKKNLKAEVKTDDNDHPI